MNLKADVRTVERVLTETLRPHARRLSLSIVLTGVTVAAVAIVGFVAPKVAANYHLASHADYSVQLVIVLSGFFGLGAFAALHLAQFGRRGYGRIGMAGFALACFGQTAVLLANLATLATGENPFGPLHAVGFLTLLPGILLLAASTSRVRLLPRWAAFLFGATPIVLFAGSPGGIVFGTSWILLGLLLHAATRPEATQLAGATA